MQIARVKTQKLTHLVFLLNQLLHYSPVCLPTCHAAHEESVHENGGGTSNILQVSHSDLRLHSFVQVH